MLAPHQQQTDAGVDYLMSGGRVCFADLSSSQRERSEREREDGGWRGIERMCDGQRERDHRRITKIFTSE